MKLSLSRVHYPITTLGPGKRVGIWFQGCSLRCAGCVSVDTWHKRAPTVSVEDLMHSLEGPLDECNGVTISGGEPFEQPEGLLSLIQAIRQRVSTNILVYSGYTFETIRHHPSVTDRLIDALITEPYVHDEKQSLPLRGSDNQPLHLLTEQGKQLFACFSQPVDEADRKLDVMFDESGEVWFAGIPRRGDLNRLGLLMKNAGHTLRTTEVPVEACIAKRN